MANQVITNYTRGVVTAHLSGLTTYMGVGKGTAAATAADTTLTTELITGDLGGSATYARSTSTTNSQQQTTVSNDTAQWIGTWTNPATAANTPAVTEVGIFDQLAVGGNMYFKAVIAALNLAPTFGVQATCQAAFG